MKNADIRTKMRLLGVGWDEVAGCLKIPLKDLTRRLKEKQASPAFRRHLLNAIDIVSSRSNNNN